MCAPGIVFRQYIPHAFTPRPAVPDCCQFCNLSFRKHPYWEEELATALTSLVDVIKGLGKMGPQPFYG